MKIEISGLVHIHRDEDYEVVEDPSIAQLFDGFHYADEEMSDYIGDGVSHESFAKIGLKGGHMTLRFDASTGRLWVVTSYESPRDLNEDELAFLVEYTQGQWSDGMGENMEIDIADERGLLVELYSRDQEISVNSSASPTR